MAVDTRDKRGSCIGFVLPGRVVYPNPSGISTGSVAGRIQTAYGYAGIVPPSASLTPDGRSVSGANLYGQSVSGANLLGRTASGSNLYGPSISGRGPN